LAVWCLVQNKNGNAITDAWFWNHWATNYSADWPGWYWVEVSAWEDLRCDANAPYCERQLNVADCPNRSDSCHVVFTLPDGCNW
jgi:hypothetical protein